MEISLVILAAGMGSRYGGLKQLDGLGPDGQTIMDYSVHDAIQAGFDRIVFVIRSDFHAEFKEKVLSKYQDKIACSTVFQDMTSYVPESYSNVAEARQKPWGTGHAILVAKESVPGPFAAINADDFYGKDAFTQMAKELKSSQNKKGAYSMIGYRLKNTLSDHGSVNRGICMTNEEGQLQRIFEGLKIEKKDGQVFHHTDGHPELLDENAYVSMNFWGFTSDIFDFLQKDFVRHIEDTKEDPKSEYFIPFVVNDMMGKGLASVKVIPTSASWQGVTYQEDRPVVVQSLSLMSEEGVYPHSF
jgi:UTP-glucose-1-phosphate uridylyltransferase